MSLEKVHLELAVGGEDGGPDSEVELAGREGRLERGAHRLLPLGERVVA